MKFIRLIYIIFITFILISCTDTKSSNTNSKNNIKTSYFYDSGVQGLEYKCKSTNDTNITTSGGKFLYRLNCDEIIFSIGKITIGTIKTSDIKEKVYPSDLSNVPRDDTNNPKIINILRILQSLDDDENPYNGINITQQIRDNLQNHILRDLRDTTLVDIDLNSIINLADSTKTLIDINKSIAHFETTIRKYVNPTIDTVAPALPKLKNIFTNIDLDEKFKTVTIIGEPQAKIFVKYDNATWINTHLIIQDNGEQNINLEFNNTNQINFTSLILLQDNKENNSSILIINTKRKDTTPPTINIPEDKKDINTNSYIFNIFEKEKFIQNLNATDNSNYILTYNIISLNEDNRSVDSDLFQVDQNGTISFINQPNYDTNIGKTYNVVVRVEDNSTNKTDTHIKVILLNLLDNSPKLTQDENSTYLQTITEASLSNNNIIYDLNTTIQWDYNIAPDNNPNLAKITFYLENNTNILDVNKTTGKISIKDINNSFFDYEQNPNNLHVKFRIENNNTTIEGNTIFAFLDINLSNVIDTVPYMLAVQPIVIPEHNETTQINIITIQKDTVNSDINLDMIFSISGGNNNNAFSINSSTGEISANSDNLDYETSRTYNLIIKATNLWYNNTTHSSELNVSINLTNLIDLPPKIIVKEINNTIPESTISDIIIGRIITNGSYSDENITDIGFMLSPSNVPFRIDNNGIIKTFRQLLNDYNETSDNNSLTNIEFTVKAQNTWWDNTIHDSNILNLSVSLSNVLDNIPVIKSPNISLPFEENSSTPINTFIYQVQSDGSIYDENITNYYYLLNFTDQFDINKTTGKITLKKLFDWESLSPSYNYTLQFIASNVWWDNTEHNSSVKSINIDIKNIIEKPPQIIVPSSINIHENINNDIFINLIKADSLSTVDEQNITSISILNGNDGNFTLSNLKTSSYSNLLYSEIKTSSYTNLDYESNNSYILEINASNSFGSILKSIPINIIDDIDTNLPLLIMMIEYDDINLTSTLSDIQNMFFTNGINERYLKKYFSTISNDKFTFKAANESYDPDTNGIIKVHLNDSHPLNNPTALKIDIKDALIIADDNITFSDFDTNNNNILEANELQIIFLIAGGDITYGDNNKSIPEYTKDYQIDTNITLDGINFKNKKYAVRAERNGDHQASIGLIVKILSYTTFAFPLEDTANGIIYNYFDIMGEGFKGADINETIGSRPVHPNCYNKASQGWIDTNILSDTEIYGQNYNVIINTLNKYNSNYFNCIRINTNYPKIYYLIENRNRNVQGANDIFYDNGLFVINNNEFSGGLLTWKIDENYNPAKINIININNSNDNIFRPINTNADLGTSDFSFNTPPNNINDTNGSREYNIGIVLP